MPSDARSCARSETHFVRNCEPNRVACAIANQAAVRREGFGPTFARVPHGHLVVALRRVPHHRLVVLLHGRLVHPSDLPHLQRRVHHQAAELQHRLSVLHEGLHGGGDHVLHAAAALGLLRRPRGGRLRVGGRHWLGGRCWGRCVRAARRGCGRGIWQGVGRGLGGLGLDGRRAARGGVLGALGHGTFRGLSMVGHMGGPVGRDEKQKSTHGSQLRTTGPGSNN